MRDHWHTDATHIITTAVAVALVFQAIRVVAARMVTARSEPVSTVGKAVGGIFSFPAQ
jgi:hypothetical protein